MLSPAAPDLAIDVRKWHAAQAWVSLPKCWTVEQNNSIDPDRALVNRALSGDAAAFRELFVKHRSNVARLVARLLGNPSEVEDVTQEVFLHVFRSLHLFRGEARFSTWLYRLTVNVVRMHLRQKRSRPQLVAEEPIPEQTPSHGDDPPEAVDRRKRIQALERLIAKLSPKKREVLILHDFEGVPAKEIAQILGIPVLTVRTRLFYARKALYAAIAEDPVLCSIADAVAERLASHPNPTLASETEDP